jgi:exosortase
MDRRSIGEPFTQIMSKFLLRPSAYRDHDVRRAMLLNQRKKMLIVDLQAVPRRATAEVNLDLEPFVERPIEQFSFCAFSWQDPENFCVPFAFQLSNQVFHVPEAGNALNAFTFQQTPNENHQTAVSDCQVSCEYSAPVRLVFAQSRKTGPRRSNEKSAVPTHRRDRFIDIATKEPNPENLLSGGHRINNSKVQDFPDSPRVGSCYHIDPVQNLATAQRCAPTSASSSRRFSVCHLLSFFLLAILWFLLCQQLSAEWSLNEQYSYGWFVPFFALYFFWLRWQDRPEPVVSSQWSAVSNRTSSATGNHRALIAALVAIPPLLLLLPTRLFEIANPDWRPLAWIHATSAVTLTLLCLWYLGDGPWLRHFVFPIAFILVAVPWVTPIEGPVIQGLMRAVARVAAETAMLLGIPAHLEGNLIRVSSGLIGVNEACSGIRSLQTSLMIGLLFGELRRLSISRRVVLVAGAVAIALFANFLRAMFLVRIAATKNILEVTRWHDIAGYTIVGLVFLGTMGLAYLLGRKKPSSALVAGVLRATMDGLQPTQLPPQRNPVVSLPPAVYLAAVLCWLLFVEIGTAEWYRIHERNLVTGMRWSVQWPEHARNFHKLKIDEEIRRVLRFDEGEAAAWTVTLPTAVTQANPSRPGTISCSLYLFRWKPGRNSALLANLHRPDVCLPAIGWRQVADTGVRNYSADGRCCDFALPFRHFEFRHGAGEDPTHEVAHTFYCLWEDRATNPSAAGLKLPQMAGPRSTWTRAERLRTVLEGRRHLGQQVMEFIALSRGPVDLDQINARFAQALPELIRAESRKQTWTSEDDMQKSRRSTPF